MLKHIISAFLLLCATVAQAQTYEYRKVTSQSEIVAGGVYVLTVKVNNEAHYATGFSSGFTTTDHKTFNDTPFYYDDACELTLEKEENKDGFLIKVKGYGYLQNNKTAPSTISAIPSINESSQYYLWEISIDESEQHYATINVTDRKSRTIRFNENKFHYLNSGGYPISLYRKYTTTPPAQDKTVSINECGYATLCSDVALDFTDSGVEAYTGSISGDKLLLTKVDKVPAGAGVILYKENGGSATISAANGEVTALENNVLRGTTEAKTVRAGEKIYVLQNVDGEAAFCQVKQDTTLAKGKAYLDLSDSPVSAAKLTVAFSTPTSITAIQSTPNHTAHTLSGQRVSTAYRGIVVRDGKKIIQR